MMIRNDRKEFFFIQHLLDVASHCAGSPPLPSYPLPVRSAPSGSPAGGPTNPAQASRPRKKASTTGDTALR
jgi:hypothetical protein